MKLCQVINFTKLFVINDKLLSVIKSPDQKKKKDQNVINVCNSNHEYTYFTTRNTFRPLLIHFY